MRLYLKEVDKVALGTDFKIASVFEDAITLQNDTWLVVEELRAAIDVLRPVNLLELAHGDVRTVYGGIFSCVIGAIAGVTSWGNDSLNDLVIYSVVVVVFVIVWIAWLEGLLLFQLLFLEFLDIRLELYTFLYEGVIFAKI